MINAPHDKEFHFHDGSRAKNLLELVSKIEHLSDHEFHVFVNDYKNDFSNWIEHVLSDKEFAQRLRTIHSRNDTIQAMKDKIADFTIGNSIIKIPRLEDHTHDARYNTGSEHNAKPPESSKEQAEHHAKHHSLFWHHSTKSPQKNKIPEKHVLDSVPPLVFNERHRPERTGAGHNWFRMFSKKNLQEKKLEHVELEEENKLHAESGLREELDNDGKENALWVSLYIVLVLLIIILVVYKLFL